MTLELVCALIAGLLALVWGVLNANVFIVVPAAMLVAFSALMLLWGDK